MKQVTLRVRENKYSKDYEGCSHCIHRKDTVEICLLRKCVHAINDAEIEDCYIPLKSAEKELQRLLKDFEL